MSNGSPLQALVVDDEPLSRDELRFLLSQCENVEVVGEACDALEALAFLREKPVDLVFVDLRMPGPDGISLAEALRARDPQLPVVVVSAHDDGALRAFDAQVLDYLLKPVRLERLQSTVERAVAQRQSARSELGGDTHAPFHRLAVRRRGSYVVLELADVVYFEVKDELVWAVTESDRFALDLTLSALEQRVPAGRFFRSHRGILVRIDSIRAIEPSGAGTYALILDHPQQPRVPLARERARVLRTLIPFTG